MIRIVFWNVGKKDLTNLVIALADATQADIIFSIENVAEKSHILQSLKSISSDFYIPNAVGERFHCFCRKKELDVSEVHNGFRTSVRILRNGGIPILLAFVHGIDMRNHDHAVRQSEAQSLVTEINFVREQKGTNKLVFMGDFNMNPYDSGMYLAAEFNAMMTKECVKPKKRIFQNREYEFYYNPMWSLFGDNTVGPAGTVYDTSNVGPYGWSMLDQVVLNHSVTDIFEEVKILTHAGTNSLMNSRGHSDSKHASDHFPIQLTLRSEK